MSLKELLAQQKTQLKERTEGLEGYAKAHIPDAPWEGFWYLRSNSSESTGTTGYKEVHITEDGSTILGRWREGKVRYVLRGTLSHSRLLMESGTIHTIVPGGRLENTEDLKFHSPVSMKMGHGHSSITINFDWSYRYPTGTDAAVMCKVEKPFFVAVYTTGDSIEAKAKVTAVVQRVAELSNDEVVCAPLITTNDQDSSGTNTIVLRKTFAAMLDNEDFIVHWSEGGLWNNSDLVGLSKVDVDSIVQGQAKMVIAATDMKGAAQIRQQRYMAMLIHLEFIEDRSQLNNKGSDQEEDIQPSATSDAVVPTHEDEKLVLPPRVVDSVHAVTGVFRSTETAAQKIHALVMDGKPTLL